MTDFTPREREVMRALVTGAPTTDHIALRLGIATSTVTTHLQHVFDKLGVQNRVDAAVRWLQGGHDMATLIVSEVFGPTVQGEGPSAGRRCMFVRLGRCNLDCAWCDTPYTWDWTGKNGVAYDPATLDTLEVGQVVESVSSCVPRVGLVVISGGEPMTQRSGLTALVSALVLDASPPRIEIETNGTQLPWPTLRHAHFNVSPKLSSSGVDRSRAWVQPAIEALRDTGRAVFKFVIGDGHDLRDVDTFVAVMRVPADLVWLMPQTQYGDGPAPGVPAAAVAQYAIDRGWNYSDRLHVRLWGDERGR